MKYPLILLCILFFLAGKTAAAADHSFSPETALPKNEIRLLLPDSGIALPADSAKVSRENKRAIAAILAFPLPFGVLGLHRIYLGTAAWVPVAYVVTLGGFGVLSLIDFIYIIAATDEEFEALSHNGKLFVWVK